ncbi:hypothetical protein HAX54_000211, partial [Datura stramonium]|nr:hypothetical protein [Datura stramonium]
EAWQIEGGLCLTYEMHIKIHGTQVQIRSTQVVMQVLGWASSSLPTSCIKPMDCELPFAKRRNMSSSRQQERGKDSSSSKSKGKGKEKVVLASTNSRGAIWFCVALVTIEEDIPRQDLKFEAKLCIASVCSCLMPSKNDQWVNIKAAILIVCIMTGVHVNFGAIVATQFQRKARKQGLSMPFPIINNQLCARAGVPYFPDERPSFAGVIDVEKKRDVDAPKRKRK